MYVEPELDADTDRQIEVNRSIEIGSEIDRCGSIHIYGCHMYMHMGTHIYMCVYLCIDLYL